MSPLTKVFVILVTLLSIVLAALVVPFAANVDDLKSERDRFETQFRAAQASVQQSQQALQEATSRVAEAEASQNATIEQLRAERNQLQGNLTAVQADLAREKANQQALQATVETFTANDATKTELLRVLNEQLQASQTKVVDQAGRITQLEDAANELGSQVAALQTAVRRFTEQNAQSQRQVAALQQQLTGAGLTPTTATDTAAAPSVAVTDEPVYGKVTGTREAAAGQQLVELNVGRADGLAQGMRLLVYRGSSDLVAIVDVRSVDESVAVASVVSRVSAIQAGDNVVTATGL